MANIGTTFTKSGKKAVLCGSGELGKEVALELQRYGVEVVALDKYANAPAMHVAHRNHVLSMLDGDALETVIREEKPDYIIPEIEAIATDRLVKLEEDGFNVVPTAKATRLTMNREGIRRLAAETLGLTTSPYRFAETREEFDKAVEEIGIPCVVKPVMSSSGHGQSTIKCVEDIDKAWTISQEGGRAGSGKVIVEGFVKFDYEITLLTVRHCAGTTFLKPVGHLQVDGDYRESWQPQPMADTAIQKAEYIAKAITDALGGYGIFGVETHMCLYVQGAERIRAAVEMDFRRRETETARRADEIGFENDRASVASAVATFPATNVRLGNFARTCSTRFKTPAEWPCAVSIVITSTRASIRAAILSIVPSATPTAAPTRSLPFSSLAELGY